MAITYSIPNGIDGNPSTSVIIGTDENGNQIWIPTDPSNSDYQAYLATLPSESSIPSTPQAGA